MRKILILMVMVVMLFASAGLACTKGDVNFNGRVTEYDADLALAIAIGLPIRIGPFRLFPPYYSRLVLWAADMNNDGTVDISDVILILNKANDIE